MPATGSRESSKPVRTWRYKAYFYVMDACLVFAGLGLIAVARREAVGAANDALGKLQSARRQAEAMAGQAQRDVLERLADVREHGEASVERFSADVETRLQPVLAKLGLKQQARKPAARSR